MPNAFLKLDLEFTLVEEEANGKRKKYGKIADSWLKIRVNSEDNYGLNIGFGINQDSLVDGNLFFDLQNDAIAVVCQGIFKVNVKSAYLADVLDSNATWEFAQLDNRKSFPELKIASGIEPFESEFFHHRLQKTMTEVSYPIAVSAAVNKTALKATKKKTGKKVAKKATKKKVVKKKAIE